MTPIFGMPGCSWSPEGFFVREVPFGSSDAAIRRDENCGRELAYADVSDDRTRIWLHYRLKMVEDVLGSGEIPTGEVKVTWAPKIRRERGGRDASKLEAPRPTPG